MLQVWFSIHIFSKHQATHTETYAGALRLALITGDIAAVTAPSGLGFGVRIIHAILYGCIPVVIQDEVSP